MHTQKRSIWFGSVVMICLIAASLCSIAQPTDTSAQGRRLCSTGAFAINQTLPNGASWSMCWEERSNEGIVLHNVRYTPPNGAPRLILAQMNLAQIHVPYDDNTARFHDLSDYGLGDGNLNNMNAADCPNGTLVQNNGKNVLCHFVAPSGYAYKYRSVLKQATSLVVFSVSHIGEYNYVVQWTFGDDGTIEPAVGATGKLQKYTTDPRYSWPLNATQRGTSHVHNYYWRLDFDVAGSTNNVVEMIEFGGSGTAQRPMALINYTTETAAQFSPSTFRSWRVKNTSVLNSDNHVVSYELAPGGSETFRGPNFEPWTKNDVYVTQYNLCERWASHNSTGGGCGDDLSAFVNGQTVQDPIVWYGVTFHHLARDEDQPIMSSHWSSFTIAPRDMDATQQR